MASAAHASRAAPTSNSNYLAQIDVATSLQKESLALDARIKVARAKAELYDKTLASLDGEKRTNMDKIASLEMLLQSYNEQIETSKRQIHSGTDYATSLQMTSSLRDLQDEDWTFREDANKRRRIHERTHAEADEAQEALGALGLKRVHRALCDLQRSRHAASSTSDGGADTDSEPSTQPAALSQYLSSCSQLVALVAALREAVNEEAQRELASQLRDAARQHVRPGSDASASTLGHRARHELEQVSMLAVQPAIVQEEQAHAFRPDHGVRVAAG